MGDMERDLLLQLKTTTQELTLIREALQKLLAIEENKMIQNKLKDVEMQPNFLYSTFQDLVKEGKIAERVGNACTRANILVLNDLAYCTKSEIQKVQNLGKKSLDNLLEFTQSIGLNFPHNVKKEHLPIVNVGDRIVYCGEKDLHHYSGVTLHKGDVVVVTDVVTPTNTGTFKLPRYVCRLSLTSSGIFWISPGMMSTLD